MGKAKVTCINEHKGKEDVDYKGHCIHINYRKETNDFAYAFTHTKILSFEGHGSNFDNCIDKAKRYVDMVTKGE